MRLAAWRAFAPAPATRWWWLFTLLSATAWAGIAAFLAFIIARLVRPDTNLILIWVDAYTFWVYLPAYGVIAFALLFRRWTLLGAAALVAVFHLAWVLPDYRPAESIPEAARSAPHFRLVTANVHYLNEDYSPLAAEILAAEPDIVFLQEFTSRADDAFRAAGFEDAFPFRVVAEENHLFGNAVYSKLPLQDVEVLEPRGRPIVAATVDFDGRPVRIFNIHPTSPGLGAHRAADWNSDWRAVLAFVAREDLPLVLAGDFNMNQHHRWYGELEGEGLDSCHEERGRGNATTWPKGRKLRPIRLDHVFHSEQVVCLAVREGLGEGSDHRPVIADLAVLGP